MTKDEKQAMLTWARKAGKAIAKHKEERILQEILGVLHLSGKGGGCNPPANGSSGSIPLHTTSPKE